jgi:hypothetical protein
LLPILQEGYQAQSEEVRNWVLDLEELFVFVTVPGGIFECRGRREVLGMGSTLSPFQVKSQQKL